MESNKIKLLILWDILCKYTDEEHAMNTDEIIAALKEKGNQKSGSRRYKNT